MHFHETRAGGAGASACQPRRPNWVRLFKFAASSPVPPAPNWVRLFSFASYSPDGPAPIGFVCSNSPGHRPSRPLAPAAGVTLMEMLVVVMIIALLAGISVPAVSAGIDSVRLRSATDSISTFLNAAQVRAERRQEPIELIVSPKQNTFELYSNEPGFTRELKMPDGITIEAVLPPQADDAGPRRLMLLPGGAIPAIGVQVANRHGSRRIVHLDPMTGYPRVDVVAAQ
ncbi:MAG TPA: prepilin-type N-terminal cleavage/methylation domain-containing protein [Bryobacteraceae bacterium]|nr:prepilin-type N-terminal cleavage/methylation domain-containing protein [Bryobacteraceae bacterium]